MTVKNTRLTLTTLLLSSIAIGLAFVTPSTARAGGGGHTGWRDGTGRLDCPAVCHTRGFTTNQNIMFGGRSTGIVEAMPTRVSINGDPCNGVAGAMKCVRGSDVRTVLTPNAQFRDMIETAICPTGFTTNSRRCTVWDDCGIFN